MDTFELEAHYRQIFLQEDLTGPELEAAIRRAVGRPDPRPNSVDVPASPPVPSETRQPESTPTQPKLPF